MKEKLHFCGLSTAIDGTLKSSGFSGLGGIVLVFLFLFINVEGWGQSVGDYQSKGNGGPWTSTSSWETWNGSAWVNATYYPGEITSPTQQTYGAVTILNGDTITISSAGITTAPMGIVTINGILQLNGDQNVVIPFFINTPLIDVVPVTGFIYFVKKANLILPEGAVIQVISIENPLYEGLVVEKNCTHLQQISIGSIIIAFCQGPGQVLNFEELMALGGSLFATINYTPINCSSIQTQVTGFLSHITAGIENQSNYTVTWNVTLDNNPYYYSTTNDPFILDLTIDGYYQIAFTAIYTYLTNVTVTINKTIAIPNGVHTWNGTNWNPILPQFVKKTVINGPYNTTINGSFSACTMTVNSGKTLTIGPGNYVDIQGNITNNGVIDVLHQGSLRQKDSLATYIKDTNAQNYVRKTTDANILNYSYIYWSSPVSGETFNSVFAANRQNRIYQYLAANYMDLFSGKYTQSSGSPDGYDDDGNDWGTASGTITPGKGYIVMAAGTPTYFHPTLLTGTQPAQSVVFDGGQLNTGNIPVPVYKDLYHFNNYDTTDIYTAQTYKDKNTNLNLLGNPYPSAIDIKELYKDNSSILTGTFYFWEQNTGLQYNIGPSTYDFSNANYFTVTTNGTTVSSTKYEFIASGQGFMANVSDNGNVVFNNSMRVTTPNTSFKRVAASSIADRVWLNLTQENGATRQLMVGFHDSTSDNFKSNEDGINRFIKNELDFYSLIPENGSRLSIQMLAPFEENKIIPLGINIKEAGVYKIGIDQTEGVFAETQKVYIQDLYTNNVYDLSLGAFTFETVAGENINDRFVLRFTQGKTALGVEETIWEDLKIYPNPSKGLFNISYFDTAPLRIEIYDLSGKQLKITNGTNQVDLSGYAKGIYFAKIQTETNSVTKKLVVE